MQPIRVLSMRKNLFVLWRSVHTLVAEPSCIPSVMTHCPDSNTRTSRMLSSGIWQCRVVLVGTDVSEERGLSFQGKRLWVPLNVENSRVSHFEDGGDMFLRTSVPTWTTPRRHIPLLPPWEHQILHVHISLQCSISHYSCQFTWLLCSCDFLLTYSKWILWQFRCSYDVAVIGPCTACISDGVNRV
jgi:hypothetical protein